MLRPGGEELNDREEALFDAYDYGRNPPWRRRFIILAFLPFSYIAITALYVYLQWEKIDRFSKNSSEVITLLVTCLILFAPMLLPIFFVVLNHNFKTAGVQKHSPVLRARGKLATIILLLALMHWIVTLMCYLSAAPSLAQLIGESAVRFLWFLLITPLAVAVFFVPLYLSLSRRLPSTEEGMAKEDEQAREYWKHWKFGMFYWNRDDPSFVVPRPFGMGVTLNLASPLAWIFLGLIMLPVVFLLAALILRDFFGETR